MNNEVEEEIEIVYSSIIDSFQVFYYEDKYRVLKDSKHDFKMFLTQRLKEGFAIEDFQEEGEFEE